MLDKRNIINQAISTGSMVHIVYKDYHDRITERTITPLEWVTFDKIHAFCHLRGEERDFRVDRITNCKVVEAKKKAQTRSRSELLGESGAEKLATPRPVARKVKRTSTRKGSPESKKELAVQRFTEVKTADQWSRLVNYYTECLVRENQQQYIIENKRGFCFFFSTKAKDIHEFLAGRIALEFQSVHSGRPTPVARFVKRGSHRQGQQLCLGYPIFAVSSKKIAPLIFASVEVEESNNTLCLRTDYPEPSYAVFRSLKLKKDEIEAVLAECASVQPQRGRSETGAWEDFLIERLSEIMGDTLHRRDWDTSHPTLFKPGDLYTAPCLFWVKESIATANLIKELRELSAPNKWDLAPQALKELLSSVPEKDYPDAPSLKKDSNVYVTEVNEQQRQAIAAALSRRVTIVTGPPGTGKSQMVLNLVAQAVLRDRSVLFASRNNKAVDVVMDRLKNEIKFSGAVRTGNKEIRPIAATDMAAAMDHISAADASSLVAPLREEYLELKKRAADAEETLDRIRDVKGLLESHCAERDALVAILPKPVVKVVQSHPQEYRREELHHLQTIVTNLLTVAFKMRDMATQLENRIFMIVEENQHQIPLLDALAKFEDQWGSFGGGFLHPRQLDTLESSQTYVQTWLTLLSALDVQIRITRLTRLYRETSSSYLQHQADLDAELEAQVESVVSKFEAQDLTPLVAQAGHLSKRAIAIEQNKLSFWEKLLNWIGFENSAQKAAEQFVDLAHSLELDWEPLTPLEDFELTHFVTVCHQLAKFSTVCQLQRRMTDTREALEDERQRLGETTVNLPPTLQDDIGKVELSDMNLNVLREPMESILAYVGELINRRDQLTVRINAKLDANGDALQTLDDFKTTPAGKDKRLWMLRVPIKLQIIISHLTKWRNLVLFWETNQAIRHLQKQKETLPTETEAVARVRELQEKQRELGANIIRSRWLERAKDLSTPTLQKARRYVSAIQQLSKGYDRSRYRDLKSSEETNMSGALEVFPVWATTNLAAKTNLSLSPELFDIVIIDEASQCDVPSALPLLYRAKHLVIIGDRNQLRHVATLYHDSDQEAAAQFGVAPDAFLYNTHSLFDIAQRSVGARPGTIWLKEHYRSDAQIIGFSNEEFYENRLVHRTDMERRGVPADFLKTGCGAFWIHVDGAAEHPSGGSAFNQAELNALQELIPQLEKRLEHYQTDDFKLSLGIVTPYREQANRIQNWVSHKFGSNSRISVGTAHTFQGDERDIIIFSPVLAPGLTKGSLNWLNRTENLLNVAITRARLQLVVLGHWNYCHDDLPPANKYRRLAGYIGDRLNHRVQQIDNLPILSGTSFDVIGILLDPRRTKYNRTTLRRLITSCREFVWWVDPFLQNHVFDLIRDVFQHPQIDIRDVRLLTSIEQTEPTQYGKPSLDKERAKAIKNELHQRGVSFEIRFLPKRELPHDRFFYSLRQSINMPPFGGAYGDHKHVSEYTQSTTDSTFFEQYWNQARIDQESCLR